MANNDLDKEVKYEAIDLSEKVKGLLENDPLFGFYGVSNENGEDYFDWLKITGRL